MALLQAGVGHAAARRAQPPAGRPVPAARRARARKLQDLFVDRKVPRAERDRVPIVVDACGQIRVGRRRAIADECRVTAPEAGVVILELTEASMNSTLKSLLFWLVLVVILAS